LNGDGYITFHELVAYVTPRASNDYETPGDGVLPGHQEGEFIFLNPKGPGRAVTGIPVPASTAKRNGESVIQVPFSADTARMLATFFFLQGNVDGAIKEEREAIRLKPDDERAHEALGGFLGRKGDLDGEIEEEREAIRLKPDLAIAHYDLGWALEHKGDRQSAMAEYRRALELWPGLPDAQTNLDNLLKEANATPK
jgi:Flp pilus assembly protein TadD